MNSIEYVALARAISVDLHVEVNVDVENMQQ